MKARSKSGKIVSGVIARILVKNGRATEIGNSANLISKPKVEKPKEVKEKPVKVGKPKVEKTKK